MKAKLGEGSTPGPWELGPKSLGRIHGIYRRGHGEICMSPSGTVNVIKAWQANARLIAKAPLLMEIRDILERLTDERMMNAAILPAVYRLELINLLAKLEED